MFLLRVCTMLTLWCLWSAQPALGAKQNLNTLDYVDFPFRKSEEAAVVEWGHSAVISALEAAVAGFGPQTSRGAYFEVETSVVLADPIDGNIDSGYETLENAGKVEGNMVVMTNAAFGQGVTGIDLAKLAQKSGAAALMVVNVEDSQTPDFIYSLQAETEEEQEWAENHCDIPVVMVSLTSGNVLTTAQDQSVNQGMPDRVRLYAGGDRPFFEDVSTAEPMVYLIHHLLTDEECDDLIKETENGLRPVQIHPLEGTFVPGKKGLGRVAGVERTFLWKGALKGHKSKSIDERLEQVTGFPADHMSDFQVNRYAANGAHHGPHYDVLPTDGESGSKPYSQQLATVTIFLNDWPADAGGELVFPSADPPVRIRPKKGMAVVHHNLREDSQSNGDGSAGAGAGGVMDPSSIHAELLTSLSSSNTDIIHPYKWTAKRWIYTDPLPPTRKVLLPLLAFPLGGRLPEWVKKLYDVFVDKLGPDTGGMMFDKFIFGVPIALLLMLASVITNMISSSSSSTDKSTATSKKSKNSGGGSKKTKKSSKKKD